MGTAREEEGGMNLKSSIDIYTLPCVKQTARGKMLYNTGSPAWRLKGQEWVGREVQEGEDIHIYMCVCVYIYNIYVYICIYVCMCMLVTQLCLTLCDPMDCSPPGSSVRGILQARILEWVAMSFSRESSQPRDQTRVSRIAGRVFTI